MIDCGGGHTTLIRVAVIDRDGNKIADSRDMAVQLVEDLVSRIAEGECPVCSGQMATVDIL